MKKLLLSTSLLACVVNCHGTIINAASGSFIDVSNAVSMAIPGDTVQIPVGTNSWHYDPSKTVTNILLKGITVTGAGTNQTILIDDTPAGAYRSDSIATMFTISMTNGYLTRLCNIQIQGGITNSSSGFNQRYSPTIAVGASNSVRIDHIIFNGVNSKNITTYAQLNGLIDHVHFSVPTLIANPTEFNGDGFGDDSWATPYVFGTSNATYVEDCSFSSADNFGAVDVANGGRAVFRYCMFLTKMDVNTHGTESANRYRSARAIEVYNNSFSSLIPFDYKNTAVFFRGGTAAVFNNISTNYYSIAAMTSFRAPDNSPVFYPWYGISGLSDYDSNGPALLSGFAQVTTNLQLVMTNATWTNNQWLGCVVYNSNAVAGVKRIGLVQGNNATNMWFHLAENYPISFVQGDPFVIHKVYPAIDQIGRGQGDLLSGGTPAVGWPHQASEPIFVYSNICYFNGANIGNSIGNDYANLVAGRDYTNGVKPNYTPFTYPHPLQNYVPPVPPPLNTLIMGTIGPNGRVSNMR